MFNRVGDLRIPAAVRPRAAEVIEITDRFCAEHLDLEYAELCRQLVGRLARKRPSPLVRGRPEIWAGGVLHAIGTLNFLFDPSQRPHLTVPELFRLAGVSQATASNKSREIRSLLRLDRFDPDLSRREVVESSPLLGPVEAGGFIVPPDLAEALDEETEEFLEEWDEADRQAAALLRQALPEVRDAPPPRGLGVAAATLRQRLRKSAFELRPVVRANGWSKRLPADDRQLLIETVGALIAMKNDTGLDSELESLLITLQRADWLGAVIGMVRGGAGTRVTAARLVTFVDACPEVEGEVDEDDRDLMEGAFDLILPTWQAAGALDDHMQLTELGRWGLPRALAWAWNADFDRPPGVGPVIEPPTAR